METTTATNPEQTASPAPEGKLELLKHIHLKWLIMVFLIFFTILIALLLILHFEKQKQGAELPETPLTTPESQGGSGATATQTPTAPEAPASSGQSAADAAYIEQIKMDIITGKREDVPSELAEQGKDKQIIIAEYLYSCYEKTDIGERVKCYEVYYLNNDASYRQPKENCEKLSGAELAKCLDELYYYASAELSLNLCPAIRDDILREDCLTSIK